MDWDPDSLRKRFRAAAKSANRFRRQVGPKMIKKKTYRTVYVQHLAEAQVCDELQDSAMLETREGMIEGLRRMLEDEGITRHPEAQEVTTYQLARRDYIQKLLEEFESS